MTAKNNNSYIALFIGALLISFSPVLIKMAEAPGTITVFYRLIFGTIALVIPFTISRIKAKSKLSLNGIFIATLAGFLLATDMAFWSAGIKASNAAMPTIVGNLAPVWVGIGAYFIYKERQQKKFWFGLILALLGVAFLILHDLYFPTGIFKGLIFGLLAGIFYAGFMLVTQKGRKVLDTLSYLFLSTLATAVFLGIFALVQQQSFSGYSSETWLIFAIMGLALQAGAWFFINYAQGFLPASMVSATLLAQPVLAAIIAFFMLGENLTIWNILGGAVVVTGIYIVHWKGNK